jgi:hypothetical protein
MITLATGQRAFKGGTGENIMRRRLGLLRAGMALCWLILTGTAAPAVLAPRGATNQSNDLVVSQLRDVRWPRNRQALWRPSKSLLG